MSGQLPPPVGFVPHKHDEMHTCEQCGQEKRFAVFTGRGRAYGQRETWCEDCIQTAIEAHRQGRAAQTL